MTGSEPVSGESSALGVLAHELRSPVAALVALAEAAPGVPATGRPRLVELAAALETDRTLRLGSPPPSAEQLSYSTAVIREQVRELQAVLRPPGSTPS